MDDEVPPKVPPRRNPPKVTKTTDTYQFETNEEGYSMREFFDVYSDRLPVFTMVTQGCLGLTDLETFSVEQTLFCHAFSKQRRVVARDAKSRVYSIPEDYPLKFKVVISRDRVKTEQPLREILSENQLPIQVQFSVPGDVVLKIDSDNRKAKDLTNLLLVETFEETFILANAVYDQQLNKNSMIVPLYLKDLEVSTVNGVKGMSDKAWRSLYSELKVALKSVEYTPGIGNREIAIYPDKLSTEDNVYDYIEPAEFISFAKLSQENVTDDEKYTNPYCFKRPQRENAMISELKDKLKLDVKDVSDGDKTRQDKTRKTIVRSISDTKTRQTVPPDLPPRTQSFMDRSKKMLADIPDTGEATQTQFHCDTREKDHLNHLSGVTISDISTILKQIRLEKYVDKFKKRQVDGVLVKDFSEDLLRETFHMTEFEIIKLMKFIQTGHIPK